MARPLVVAHRGASAIAPENTLEAFEKAIEIGADMVEFDVRATPDGTLVVCHDPVAEDGLGLPRLEEVVELCAGRIMLDVELKEPGLEDETLRTVSPAEFVVTSFLPDVVAETKRLRPDVRVGLLLAADAALPDTPADFLAPHVTLLDRGLVSGNGLVVWTVNDDARLRRYLADPRVAAVITDDPERALALRRRRSAPGA
jgi:glycerophosphoryl diester phosphodiesterase